MNRPAFQFYPGDWRNNAKLRRCSWEARGVWIEVMGLLHDSDIYGVLFWPLKDIALALGAPLKALRELVAKEVLKGCDTGQESEPFVYAPKSGRVEGAPVTLIDRRQGPVWYSSRMVRDEYVRLQRGGGTRFGDTPNPSPKVGIGDAPKVTPKPYKSDGPSSSSSSSSSLKALSSEIGGNAEDNARGTRLPLHWRPSFELGDWVKAEKPEVNLEFVIAKFRDHYCGKLDKREDWDGAFRNFVRNERLPNGADEPIDYAKITGGSR